MKIKCDLLNFRNGKKWDFQKKWHHRDFQYFMFSVQFFHKIATLMQSFMPAKLQSRKKKISDFSDGKTLLYP